MCGARPVATTDRIDQTREHVRHVELARPCAVRQNHVRAEDRDGQSEFVERIAQQHLTGPLGVAVAVGVRIVHRPRWAVDAYVAVFSEFLDARCDGHRRQIGHGLDMVGQRQPDDLGRADDVGSEEVLVRQGMVDERGRVDDAIDRAYVNPPSCTSTNRRRTDRPASE